MDDQPSLNKLEQKIRQLENENADLRQRSELQAKMALQLDLVRQAQLLYIAREDQSQIYDLLLKTLIEVTNSEFGFFDEVRRNDDGTLFKKNLVISNISWDDSSRQLYEQLVDRNREFHFLNNLDGLPALTGEVVIANDPANDPSAGGLPDGHPPIHNFMGLPLFFGGELIVVAGVANREGGYTKEMGDFIEPLLTTCAGITHDLAQREVIRRAEKKMRESEEKFHTSFTASAVGMGIVGGKGRFITVNDALCDMLGYTSEELIQLTFFDITDQRDAETSLRRFRQSITDMEAFSVEKRYRTKGGQAGWGFTSVSPVFDGSGGFRFAIVHLQDITRRKLAEEKLRLSESLLKQSQKVANVGSYSLDIASKQIDWSDQLYRIFGYEPGEVMPNLDFVAGHVHPDDRRQFLTANDRVFQGITDSYEETYRIIRKDGAVRTFHSNGMVEFDQTGKPQRTYGSYQDITERKSTEVDLRRWERLFRHAQWGIAISEDKKTIQAMNPAYARMHGFPIEKIKNEPIENLFAPGVRPALRDHLEKAYRKGQHAFNSSHLRKDGSTFPCRIDISVVKKADGTPLYHVAHVTDITVKIQHQEELKMLRLAVEQSSNGIIITDLDGKIVFANPASEAIYGYRPGEFIGQNVKAFNVESAVSAALIIPAIKETGRWNGELEQKKKDGFRFSVHLSASLVTKGTQVISMLWIVTDISEMKKAEAELKNRAHRLAILREVERYVLESRSVEKIAAPVLDKLYQVVRYDRASVIIFDFEAGEARFAATNIGGETVSGTREPWSFDFIFGGRAPLLPEPVLVTDIESLPVKSPIEQRLLEFNLRAYISVPMKTRSGAIGLINFASRLPDAFGAEQLEIATEISGSLALAIRNAQLVASLETSRSQLQSLAARLIETEERERKWLACELHDQIGQNLTALNINLTMLQHSLPKDSAKKILVRMNDSFKLLKETTARIRNLMSELRPSVLDDYGLAAALRWHAEHFSERTGIQIDLQIQDSVYRLKAALETALFRIFQEALTNVAKHSGARQVTVTLEEKDGSVRLTITDDGQGFSTDRLKASEADSGWGLKIMRERIVSQGGEFNVVSTPGPGATIEARVKAKK